MLYKYAKASWKRVHLHNGNKYVSIPIAYSVNLKEYENSFGKYWIWGTQSAWSL